MGGTQQLSAKFGTSCELRNGALRIFFLLGTKRKSETLHYLQRVIIYYENSFYYNVKFPNNELNHECITSFFDYSRIYVSSYVHT